MRIVALEEHFVVPEVLDAWSRLPGRFGETLSGYGDDPLAQRLRDVGDRRRADMDDQGVDVQVLSLNTPGVQNLAAADAVSVARDANDALAGIIATDPGRFQGFAAIPTPDAGAAAAELQRTVADLGFRGAMLNGRTGTTSLDDPRFDDLYGVAERLRAPLHLHPQTPVQPVQEAYYTGFGAAADSLFANFGIGWHYETGVQLLRMIFGGVFDRHPDLQVIVGHWGEVVLFYLERIAQMQRMSLHLERPLADYFRRNVWVHGSGVLSERYLRWTTEVVGTDRILYATDYPFVDTFSGKARAFLEGAPLSDAEKTAMGSGNWERLTGHLGRPSAA